MLFRSVAISASVESPERFQSLPLLQPTDTTTIPIIVKLSFPRVAALLRQTESGGFKAGSGRAGQPFSESCETGIKY